MKRAYLLSFADVVQAVQDPFTSGEGPSSTDTQAAALAANGWYHPSGQSSPRLHVSLHDGGSQPAAPSGEVQAPLGGTSAPCHRAIHIA